MIGIYKASILSFLLPIISAIFALFIPDVNNFFNYIVACIFILNISVYLVLLTIFKKKKRQNAAKLVITMNMLTFSFFFAIPLLKLVVGQFWLQLILFALFFILIVLGVRDQKQETPIVFPDTDKETRKYAYVFYAIPVLLVICGGGGNILVYREMNNLFGDTFTSVLGSILLYIFGCWFAFFFSSLYYKGLVKDGGLIK